MANPTATARIWCCARRTSITASRPGRQRSSRPCRNRLNRLNLFSPEHDDLAASLYADAFPIDVDKEGRVVLPDSLVSFAGLTDAVVFMGLGRIFQIWEPGAAERRRSEARERARAHGFTLPAGTLPAGPAQ